MRITGHRLEDRHDCALVANGRNAGDGVVRFHRPARRATADGGRIQDQRDRAVDAGR